MWTAGIAAAVNAVVGTAIAWTLVRWDVPGRRLIGALVDLPLAIPTLVAGVLIIALFGPQTAVGRMLGEALGANPHTLRSKMRRLGIGWGRFRGGA